MTQVIAPTRAALSILAGMATLGLSDNFILYITEDSSLWQFHLLRSVIALAVMIVIAMIGAGVIRPKRFWAVAARSAVQGIAMLIYFGCLAILPVGLVVAGFFTSPLFVALIAAVFQGKRITPLHAVAIFLGFAGALMVIQPNPADLDLIAFLPIVAGLFYAIGAVATRSWCEGEGTLALTAGFFVMLALMGAVGCLILPGVGAGADGFAARGWMPLNADMLFWIALQAVGTLIGIMFLFRGYQVGEASSVAVFEFSLLIFASAWAWYLWDQAVTPLALFGMALIILSGGVIALRRA
ncbi:DMT family transporter [Roseobacter sp. CCS2]|uniref:DMT family transporter n=1 Tax=Roseobacter sp. CCS2 TaxID=391593 RepID=UPI0000F403D5|nr:DMT family transporter [Roseobacter sp. CCS2]EBA12976.1 possible transporter, DME family, DMT superfamily protein [Roseobacter sp. CCS2]